MNSVYYKKYKKEYKHSYAYGVFPTLELLMHKPEQVLRVFIHTKGKQNEGIEKIKNLCQKHRVHIEKADGLLAKLSSVENCYAIGVFTKYQDLINPNENHVVLVNPSDPSNVGTIIRTMIGFDTNNLAIIRPAIDVFDPKVIRASMGSIFQIHYTYYNTFEEYQKSFQNYHLYPFMSEGKYILGKHTIQKPFSLVFGNEGSGLPDTFKHIGDSISIPQGKAIDSFNLSVAVAIALYETNRQ